VDGCVVEPRCLLRRHDTRGACQPRGWGRPVPDIFSWLTISALRFSEALLEARRIVDTLSGEITAVVPGKDSVAVVQALSDAQRRSAPPLAGEELNHALINLFETYAIFAAEAVPRLPPAGHAEPAWINERLEALDQLERAAEIATPSLVEVRGLEDAATPRVPMSEAWNQALPRLSNDGGRGGVISDGLVDFMFL
jgi:hypothetical protein